MRLPGYCTGCHKIKQVQVSASGLVTMAARRGVAQGICADCQEKQDEKRGIRRGRR